MSKEVATEAAFEARLVVIRNWSIQVYGEVFAPSPLKLFRPSRRVVRAGGHVLAP